MDKNEFRKRGHELVDWMADYLESKERAIENIKQEITLTSTIMRTKFKLLDAIGFLNRLQLLSL